jgi:CheY-like chemotaxis protein
MTTSPNGFQVLVVDDDRSIRQVVVEALEREGYRVLAARNGEEALALLARERPDVVLLDRWMPVMDGREFARQIKALGISPLIIAMTAAPVALRWAALIGADASLDKPFEIDDLLDLVARCCGRAQLRETPTRTDLAS